MKRSKLSPTDTDRSLPRLKSHKIRSPGPSGVETETDTDINFETCNTDADSERQRSSHEQSKSRKRMEVLPAQIDDEEDEGGDTGDVEDDSNSPESDSQSSSQRSNVKYMHHSDCEDVEMVGMDQTENADDDNDGDYDNDDADNDYDDDDDDEEEEANADDDYGDEANDDEVNADVDDDVNGEDDYHRPRASQSCTEANSKDRSATKKRVPKPGIIYLSATPRGMRCNTLLYTLSGIGKIGHIQMNSDNVFKRYGTNESWVEFLDKKDAKKCVLLLNGKQVGGRKRYPWHDSIWNMKYLPKFQWGHLQDKLDYEQATVKNRLKTEIAQARKEAAHFAEQYEFYRRDVAHNRDWQTRRRKFDFTQRVTDEEIKKHKMQGERYQQLQKSRNNVLTNLFGASKK